MHMKPLILSKQDEYFVAVAKQKNHSFVMLGVIHNGEPKLLLRVGKTNNIDPHFSDKLNLYKEMMMLGKVLGRKMLARIDDEGITRKENKRDIITYQAYSITFDQTRQFMSMISKIE